MKNKKRIVSAVLASMMLAATMAGCGGSDDSNSGSTSGSTSGSASGPDLSEHVDLVYYMWGEESAGTPDLVAEINKLLEEDLNATISFKWIAWSDTATKYPLLFASGEKFDLTEASPTFAAPYQTIANQGALADLTEYINAETIPDLYAAMPENYWDTVKVNGKIYGVPTLYQAFNAYGIVSRSDIQEKAGITEINSIETAEQYFDACLEEGYVPLNGNSGLANDMYRTFLALTSTWVPEVPGIQQSELSLSATSYEDFTDVFHPAFTDEFMDWAKKMKEWADKGYWSTDVMSAPRDDKDNFNEGMSGAYITHQPDWTGSYQAFSDKNPGVTTNFWCYTEDNGKMKRMAPCENICSVSSTSENPERALLFIEKAMTDERYYRLMQYGIEGRQYEIVDGKSQTPASYDQEKDAAGFSAWSLRNMDLNIPYASEDPRRYTLNEEWDKIAIDDPYAGFAFDPSNVSAEISAISNVNVTYGNPLMLGKATKDVEEAVQEYRDQLTAAGIDKVIEELKSQLDEWVASK